jgi:hypothetical protein
MAVDVKAWRQVVEDVVGGIADEAEQRRSWFGIGPEESSPDEDFCQFFGDAAIEEFLERRDTGLSKKQIEAGRHLLKLMRALADETPDHIEPANLIDDPRWQKIREVAARFHTLLQTGNMAA